MAITPNMIHAETKPVVIGSDKEGRPIHCLCCQHHEVIKVALIRASAFELKTLLPQWFASLGVKKILTQSQSESDGNCTFTITYC